MRVYAPVLLCIYAPILLLSAAQAAPNPLKDHLALRLGVPLLVALESIEADPAGSPDLFVTIDEGKPSPGKNRKLLTILADLDDLSRGAVREATNRRPLRLGERVTIIAVDVGKRDFRLRIVTKDKDPGPGLYRRRVVWLVWPFTVQPTPDEADALIAQVLVPEPSPTPPPPPSLPPPPPPSLPPPLPPPDPDPTPVPVKAKPTATAKPKPLPAGVKVGMTEAEVLAALGAPTRSSAFGTRRIFTWTTPPVRVTVTNGKVTAVQ